MPRGLGVELRALLQRLFELVNLHEVLLDQGILVPAAQAIVGPLWCAGALEHGNDLSTTTATGAASLSYAQGAGWKAEGPRLGWLGAKHNSRGRRNRYAGLTMVIAHR